MKGLYWICLTVSLCTKGGMITTAKTARSRRAKTQPQLWSPPEDACPPVPPGTGPPAPPGVGRPERRSGREGGLISPWYAPRQPTMHAWGGHAAGGRYPSRNGKQHPRLERRRAGKGRATTTFVGAESFSAAPSAPVSRLPATALPTAGVPAAGGVSDAGGVSGGGLPKGPPRSPSPRPRGAARDHGGVGGGARRRQASTPHGARRGGVALVRRPRVRGGAVGQWSPARDRGRGDRARLGHLAPGVAHRAPGLG